MKKPRPVTRSGAFHLPTESDERFGLVLFFFGVRCVLNVVLDSVWRLIGCRGWLLCLWLGDWRRSCGRYFDRCWSGLDDGRSFNCRSSLGGDHGFSWGSSGGQFGFLLQAFGFTFAATHFAWIIRRTAIAGQGAGRSSFGSRGGGLDHCWSGNRGCFLHWGRLLGNHWLLDHRLGNRGRNRSWLGSWFLAHRGGRFGNRLLGNHRLGFCRFGSGFD